ncbi:ribonuclease H-like domain-containing protein, partial [Tanacetum coccineum]
MWLFRHKYLACVTLSLYKARLVANGSIQLEGVDVDETFSPVVKPGTIRIILSLTASQHWPIHQLVVKNAFLHGDLSEMVYMHQPLWFWDSVHPDYVCLYMHDPREPHFSALKRILRAEAEYCSVANVVADTCWLRNLLRELHTPLSSATLVYYDNISAVYLSSNLVQHQHTKHIKVDIHFVQDLVVAVKFEFFMFLLAI